MQGRASLQSALILARQVALEVVELMEGPAAGELDGSNGSTAQQVSEQSISSFGSYSNATAGTFSFYSSSSSTVSQKQVLVRYFFSCKDHNVILSRADTKNIFAEMPYILHWLQHIFS